MNKHESADENVTYIFKDYDSKKLGYTVSIKERRNTCFYCMNENNSIKVDFYYF